MKNFFSLIWNKILDNLLNTLIVGLISSSIILEFFTKIKIITYLIPSFIMWQWSGWLILLLFIVILLVRKEIIKKRINKQGRVQEQPKYHASHDRVVEEREFAGVIWKIIVGTNVNPSERVLSIDEVWVWPFPRPYCPECDYELERKNNTWYCMPCKKKYRIPRDLREYTWEKIRRNYKRLIVQWGYNNFGLGDDSHKPFRTVLRSFKKEGEKKTLLKKN
ncbi:MAG: hypothetical protein PHE52_00460 [Candidatus Pacebacteria bacterium]|nr:hypothetical protein [Candidatus Paceibacterota bacterium]